MLDILSKLPKSQTHPLNTLRYNPFIVRLRTCTPTQIHRCIPRYKYFEQINLKSEIGLKMYLIMLITNSFSNRHFTSSENRSKRTLNLFQIEIIKQNSGFSSKFNFSSALIQKLSWLQYLFNNSI